MAEQMKLCADRPRPDNAARRAKSSWAERPLRAIIEHIVQNHHAFVRREIPRIRSLFDECEKSDPGRRDKISALRRFFDALADDIMAHILREEEKLFPQVRSLDEARERSSLRVLVEEQNAEHRETGEELIQIQMTLFRDLVPAGESESFSRLRAALNAFEADLKTHFGLERDVLFPRILNFEGTPEAGSS